ncbi:MAG: Protein nrde2 [Watsoniomyces obsoletus]|nr:MAG: Protein nrde2 [Watsoniomyces obsoletus]
MRPDTHGKAMGESDKSNVPKFASFKPKIQPTHSEHRSSQDRRSPSSRLEEEAPKTSSSDQATGERKKRDRSQTSGSTSSKHHSRRHASKHRALEIRQPTPLETKGRQYDQTTEIQDDFQVDKQGDVHNLVYGTIHRYSIPRYHRTGAGTILGLPSRFRAERNPTEDGIVIADRRLGDRKKREKYSFARNERKPLRKLRVPPGPMQSRQDLGSDFIPIKDKIRLDERQGGDSKHAGNGDETLAVIDHDGDQHYRSIEGKAKRKSSEVQSDEESISELSASDYEAVDYDSLTFLSRAKHAELSERVDKNPGSALAWLELIKHQDAALSLKRGTSIRRTTEAERRSTAEIKISMYEKALGRVAKADQQYEQLLLGMLDTGSTLWESKTLNTKWRTTLREHPKSVELWSKYLDYQQTAFRNFTYEGVRNVYIDCTLLLKDSICNSNLSSPAMLDLEFNLIYVILRATLIMREAGYAENALAVWEAMLELNFFAPTGTSSKQKERNEDLLASFEEFWDSEAPRIGEDGATGWKAFVQEGASDAPTELVGQQAPVQRAEANNFSSWATSEVQHSRRSRQPARTIDDIPDDDPYRVVLFSDIKEFLTTFSESQSQLYLVSAFLAFCQLPPLPIIDLERRVSNWWTDAFIRTEVLSHDDSIWPNILGKSHRTDGSDPHSMAAVEEAVHNDRTSPFGLPFKSFPVSTDTLLAERGKWATCIEPNNEVYASGEGPVPLDWLRRALRSLITVGIEGEALAEVYLAFEWSNHSESIRKIAKSLLKEYPASLRLYNAYAMIECRLGNIEKAETVFSTALKMSTSLGEDDQDDTLLWKSWVWEVLPQDPQRAMQILLSIPDVGTVPQTGATGLDISTVQLIPLLKARKFLEEALESAISTLRSSRILHLTDLLSLLIYLYENRSIEDALQVYRKTLDALQTRNMRPRYTTLSELLHQSKARLLYYHASTSSIFRPSLLREELSQSIKIFSQNTIFLSLYRWNEARFRIDDRVRSILSDFVLDGPNETVIGWIFAIWHEGNAPIGTGHNVNSIRALFEKAVASTSTNEPKRSFDTVDQTLSKERLIVTQRAVQIEHRIMAHPSQARLEEVYLTAITEQMKEPAGATIWGGAPRRSPDLRTPLRKDTNARNTFRTDPAGAPS